MRKGLEEAALTQTSGAQLRCSLLFLDGQTRWQQPPLSRLGTPHLASSILSAYAQSRSPHLLCGCLLLFRAVLQIQESESRVIQVADQISNACTVAALHELLLPFSSLKFAARSTLTMAQTVTWPAPLAGSLLFPLQCPTPFIAQGVYIMCQLKFTSSNLQLSLRMLIFFHVCFLTLLECLSSYCWKTLEHIEVYKTASVMSRASDSDNPECRYNAEIREFALGISKKCGLGETQAEQKIKED